MNGSSTGIAPNKPNNMQLKTKNQKRNSKKKLNLGLTIKTDLSIKGKLNKIRIDKNIQTTPPNLSGTDLRIA
jgi:hypothetical protein